MYKKIIVVGILVILLGTVRNINANDGNSNIAVVMPQQDILFVPENFTTIQSAVDHAKTYQSTIFSISVSENESTPYIESVLIQNFSNGLNLIRRNSSHHPIIDGDDISGFCIKIEDSRNIIIDGFILTGTKKRSPALIIEESSNCEINNNTFTQIFYVGIEVKNKCDNLLFFNNTFNHCKGGIDYNQASGNSTFKSNVIHDCAYGVSVDECKDFRVDVEYNEIFNCNVSGIFLKSVVDPEKITIQHNYIHHNQVNIYCSAAIVSLFKWFKFERNNITDAGEQAIRVCGFVNAAHNYWGDYEDGPNHAPAKCKKFCFGGIEIFGLGLILYNPWSDQPWDC